MTRGDVARVRFALASTAVLFGAWCPWIFVR